MVSTSFCQSVFSLMLVLNVLLASSSSTSTSSHSASPARGEPPTYAQETSSLTKRKQENPLFLRNLSAGSAGDSPVTAAQATGPRARRSPKGGGRAGAGGHGGGHGGGGGMKSRRGGAYAGPRKGMGNAGPRLGSSLVPFWVGLALLRIT